MATTYEGIMGALLTYLKNNITAGTFSTFQRGIVMWEQLSQVQNNQPIMRQPALFLYDGPGFGGGTIHYEQRGRSRPPVRIMSRTIVIYAKAGGVAGLPGGSLGGKGLLPSGGGPLLHPLIEAVETAMNTSDSASQGTLTLGGLVSHCWLEAEGIGITPEIDDNGQGMATLPVKIMVP